MKKLREAQKGLTEKENEVVDYLVDRLQMWIGGENFSDCDVTDIANDLNKTKPEVKGIVGSLCKKDILIMWDGLVMFNNQDEMEDE